MPGPRLIDTHCHLDDGEFDADRDAVLRRARDLGVTDIVVPAIDAATWPRLRAACADDPGLHAAYGLHPLCLAAHRLEHLAQLRDWIERERPVAVGECGLDFFIEGLDRDAQLGWFDAQLRIARDFDLPVIVHARRAVDAVIAAIRKVGGLRGVVHSFAGSEQQARQLARLGFLLGLGGPLTYPRAARLRRLAATLPVGQLLLETDGPDQPDAAHRGERNEPGYLPMIARTLAELRADTPERVAAATTLNACRLFGLPAAPAARPG
ncbi:MAG: TatD family hydrolase [Lysobacteraceae bacterium]